jgi:hypothetical protein
MNLNDDIIGGCTDMACFSNTILDPFVRSFTLNTVHFPPKDVSLVFDGSFLEKLLKFVDCKMVKSTLVMTNVSDQTIPVSEESYPMSESEAEAEEDVITVPSLSRPDSKRERSSSGSDSENSNADSTSKPVPKKIRDGMKGGKRESDYATYKYDYEIIYEGVSPIKDSINYPKTSNQAESALDKYVIGNENKNAFLQTLSKSSRGGEMDKKIIIQVKEMGDVLQVFTMLAWYVYYSNNDAYKKNFVMTTIDSIVFLLCIMFQLPCIVYEFKNEEDDEENPKPSSKQKGEKGRTRYLQRYTPKPFTAEDKINQTIDEIEIFNKKLISLLSNINSDTSIYISKSSQIKIKQEFLDYVKSLIEFLIVSVKHLHSNSEKQTTKENYKDALNDLYEKAKNEKVNIDLPNFDAKFDEFINSTKSEIETLKTNGGELLPFLQKLKINFMIYELFYEKQGKIYASTMITFLTQNRQSDTNHNENVLFFPCNKTQRQQRGKVSFAIWCQQYKQPNRGGSIMDSGLIKMPVYEKDVDNDPCIWTLQTVNMYSYLLSDIYGILIEKLGSNNISDYILYDFYTILAFHFNLCNEVFYPISKTNDIAERLSMKSETTYLKLNSTTQDIYLEQFIEYILGEYEDGENGTGEDELKDRRFSFIEEGINETKCVNNVLKDLRGDEDFHEERLSDMSVEDADIAAGISTPIDQPITSSPVETPEITKLYETTTVEPKEQMTKEYEEMKIPIQEKDTGLERTQTITGEYQAKGEATSEGLSRSSTQNIIGGKKKSKKRAKSRKNKRTRRAKNKRTKKQSRKRVKTAKYRKSRKTK